MCIRDRCLANLTLKGELPANSLNFGSNGLLWYIAPSGASFCDLRMKNPIIKVYSSSKNIKSQALHSFCEISEKKIVLVEKIILSIFWI